MTEEEVLENKKSIANHYHFPTISTDFTQDMHEKHNPIFPKTEEGKLQTSFSATKNLDMTQSPKQAPTSHRNLTTVTSFSEFQETADNPGVKSIKKMTTKPSSMNKDLKNPREFESFVENLTDRYIPAILIAPSTSCAKIVVFYHANAEDIGQAYSFCKDVNDKLEVDRYLISVTSFS